MGIAGNAAYGRLHEIAASFNRILVPCEPNNIGLDEAWWMVVVPAQSGDGEEEAGSEIEVLLGFDRDGTVLVSAPEIRWNGPASPELHLRQVERVREGEPLEVAREIRARRLKSLKRCWFCRTRAAPEYVDRYDVAGGNREWVCMGCATSELGVVY